MVSSPGVKADGARAGRPGLPWSARRGLKADGARAGRPGLPWAARRGLKADGDGPGGPSYARAISESGNWYRAGTPPGEGWLCPALFRFFRSAPAERNVKAEPLNR
jgi:hypothetical protein